MTDNTYTNKRINSEMEKRRSARKAREEARKQKEIDDLAAYNKAVEDARAERIAKENGTYQPPNKEKLKRAKIKDPIYLWIYVTRDEYELPLIVEDYAEDLAKKLRISRSCVISTPINAKKRGHVTRIKKVEYLSDDDEFYKEFISEDGKYSNKR